MRAQSVGRSLSKVCRTNCAPTLSLAVYRYPWDALHLDLTVEDRMGFFYKPSRRAVDAQTLGRTSRRYLRSINGRGGMEVPARYRTGVTGHDGAGLLISPCYRCCDAAAPRASS